ncbi:MAG TPA: DcrB-related protein [candidate division Zixibacteria bacterium]|nr:DcrB-related protein [candidate division Zixibacteria bacterium]
MAGTNNLFKIKLPKGWQDQTVHFFMGPKDSGFQHSLTLAIDPKPESDDLIEFARTYTAPWVQALPNADVLKNEQIHLDDGRPAYEVVCKSVPSEQQVLFHRRWYVIDHGVGYIFTGVFSKKTMKTIALDVLGIINSLSQP